MFQFERIIDFTTKARHTYSIVAYHFGYAIQGFYSVEHSVVINNRIQCFKLSATRSVLSARWSFGVDDFSLNCQECYFGNHCGSIQSFHTWVTLGVRLRHDFCVYNVCRVLCNYFGFYCASQGSNFGSCDLADCCLGRCFFFFFHLTYFGNGQFGFFRNRHRWIEKAGCDLAPYFALRILLFFGWGMAFLNPFVSVRTSSSIHSLVDGSGASREIAFSLVSAILLLDGAAFSISRI